MHPATNKHRNGITKARIAKVLLQNNIPTSALIPNPKFTSLHNLPIRTGPSPHASRALPRRNNHRNRSLRTTRYNLIPRHDSLLLQHSHSNTTPRNILQRAPPLRDIKRITRLRPIPGSPSRPRPSYSDISEGFLEGKYDSCNHVARAWGIRVRGLEG